VDGEVYVLGRIKELLIVRGRNYEPYDIETAIEEHESIRGGYSVVFGVYNTEQGTEDVVAVVETRAAEEEQSVIGQEIQQSLQQVFGFHAREIVFVRHGTIPRTTSGKRQRVLCREWYLTGKFAEP
jgi:acyl-CoA synthetase (AMP-forming)/AMP-acid ligase II